MATFKDKNGRDWIVTLDGPKIKMIRDQLDGLDLADLSGKAYDKMAADPVVLIDCVWLLCRKQATAANITDEQFGESLVGDAIDRATVAMLESMADFFPPESRDLLTRVVAKNAHFRKMGFAQAMKRIDDPELEVKSQAAIEKIMDRAIASALTPSNDVTNTPVH